jgi:hypothetical protein
VPIPLGAPSPFGLFNSIPTPLFWKVLFSALGLAAISASLGSRHRNLTAASWPTEGEIITSWIETGRDGTCFQISYQFEVEGRWFTSNRVAFDGMWMVGEEYFVATYPRGRKVCVHYDPNNPEIAVLECEPSLEWLVTFAVGVAFAAIGLFRL